MAGLRAFLVVVVMLGLCCLVDAAQEISAQNDVNALSRRNQKLMMEVSCHVQTLALALY